MSDVKFTPKEVRTTNLVWLLSDIMYVLMDDNLKTLKSKGLTLRHDTKYRYNKMLEAQEKAKQSFLRFSKDIMGLREDQIDQYEYDSDLMRSFILLLSDKLIGKPENIHKAWEFLFDLPSDNIFELDKELNL